MPMASAGDPRILDLRTRARAVGPSCQVCLLLVNIESDIKFTIGIKIRVVIGCPDKDLDATIA